MLNFQVRPLRSAGESAKSIAVLPFENLSDDKQSAFFANRVQDEILTDLAKVADLKVISRTSVMQYRDTGKRDLRQIARQLGVAHLLEDSVQRAGNRVRVNAQLIDAQTDAHLWAQTYDRDLADVFAIQSEIAETIAEQLEARISPNERALIECQSCQRRTDPEPHFDFFRAQRTPPLCQCGGFLKPAAISFGQSLDAHELERARQAALETDLVVALGSTLSVYPAAAFPLLAAQRGVPYVIINRGATEHDAESSVSLRIEGEVNEIFPAAVQSALT